MAALTAAILIGLQLTAEYWAFLYLAWIMPMAASRCSRTRGAAARARRCARGDQPWPRARRGDRGMSSGARAKLDGFDGLRALAALTVLTYHVALSRAFSPAGSLAPLLWELKGGVAIFFVISGALLYLPYARAIGDRDAGPGWRAYAFGGAR